jgi:curved DNA-binding protein CbpA
MMGKHWDDDIQEWVTYDLSAESKKLASMTDEEFFAIVKDKGSAYDVFNVMESESPTTNTDTEDSSLRPKKNIMDRELYDVLGIEPEATSSEIKKAYYVKARQSHPDRNPGDESAKANFQKIGQAYQVLADEKTRTAYDTRGKASLESSRTMDAGALYTLLFGTEAFEAIIGELSLSSQIKIMMDPTTRPPQLSRFRQRKRELQCALTLLNKLDVDLDGDHELFLEKARKEAAELSESPLGSTLLGVIGNVYMQRASARLSTLSYIATNTIKTGTATLSTAYSLWHGLMAGMSALEMRNLHLEAEARQKAEDDKNHVTEAERKEREKAAAGAMNLNALYGPNPTPEVKEKVRKQTKYLTGHM